MADSQAQTGDEYHNAEDKSVIQGAETDMVSGCSGEDIRTNHYIGDTYQTTGPTTTEEALIDNSNNNQNTINVQQQNNIWAW